MARSLDWRAILESYSNAALMTMSKARRLAPTKNSKAAFITALLAVLHDEESVKRAYDAVGQNERLLLALLGERKGQATARELSVAANRIGIGDFDNLLYNLMRHALVFFATASNTKYELWRGEKNSYYGYNPNLLDGGIIAVPQALALTGAVVLPQPVHNLKPFEGEVGEVFEQSPSTLLHGLFSVARWCGGRQVKITKTTGTIARNDFRILAKQFNGDEKWPAFLIALGVAAGLWAERAMLLKPAAETDRFFTQPVNAQLKALFIGWQRMAGWSEFFNIPEISVSGNPMDYLGYTNSDVPDARALLSARAFIIGTLRRQGDALKTQSWQDFSSLVAVIKSENPAFLISRSNRHNYYSYRSDGNFYNGFKKAGGSWSDFFDKNKDWELVEGRFIRQVFIQPLTWLGLAATTRDAQGELMAFRLTPLGLQALEIADESDAAPLENEALPAGKPLTVQPNFEIIAYTEPEHLPVLFQLERFADRIRADRVAHYNLSRESVYRGIQGGLSATEIKEFLTRHGKGELPQNVAYSIDDWQRLIEQVVIRRRVALLEANSAAELDVLLAQLPEGAATRLSETWALVERAHETAARQLLQAAEGTVAFDYETEIEQAFTVSDDLQVSVPHENLDLWLRAKIEHFATEIESEKTLCVFQITAESLAAAAQIGVNHRDALEFLRNFGTPPLPANVDLTLRGWGGEFSPVSLGESFVLATQEGLIDQLTQVDELRALLWLKINDRAALVKNENEPALRAALEARGLSVGAKPGARLRPPSAPKNKEYVPRPILPTHRRTAMLPPDKSQTRQTVAARPTEIDVPLERELTQGQLRERVVEAIVETRCIVIDYQGKATRNLRKIAPLEMNKEGGQQYISAWDFWRNDYRLFRLDRVRGFALLEEKFDPDKYE